MDETQTGTTNLGQRGLRINGTERVTPHSPNLGQSHHPLKKINSQRTV